MADTPRILVVDDEQGVRAAITLILESNGFVVMAVGNGHTSRKAIEMAHYDAAIVDIFMPEMDGLEIISLLREKRPDLPIIAVSGVMRSLVYPDANGKLPDFLTMATKLGAVRALQKPFKPNELLKAVRESIGMAA
jgi:CheY-like chemotaxis protein